MPDARLCDNCWKITTEYPQKRHRKQTKPAQPGPETCDLCRLIRDSIIAFRDLGDKPELLGLDWRLPEQKLIPYHADGYPTCGVNVAYTRPVAGARDMHAHNNGYGGGQAEVKVASKAELEITTPHGQNLPWGGFANATDISNYSGNEECFTRIDEWLEECMSDHRACNERSVERADTEGPKRLVDTGSLDGDPTLRLVDYPDTDGEIVKYCALSYCWGKEGENYTTTRETYDLRREGIKIEELPWMFRDAVVISRRAGCRYLWVCSASHFLRT
jgi:hypothetical protein